MFKFWQEFMNRLKDLTEAIHMHKSAMNLLTGQVKILGEEVGKLKEELKKNGR